MSEVKFCEVCEVFDFPYLHMSWVTCMEMVREKRMRTLAKAEIAVDQSWEKKQP